MKFIVRLASFFCIMGLCFLQNYPSYNQKEENERVFMVIKVEKERAVVSGTKGEEIAEALSGEIIYKIKDSGKKVTFELDSIGLVSRGIETEMGNSGNISMKLRLEPTKTEYNPTKREIWSDFFVEVHYTLVDQKKGYIEPEEDEREFDFFQSFTEIFKGFLRCNLSEPFDPIKSIEKKIKAEIRIEMDLVKKVLGEIRQIWGNFKEVDVRVIEEPKISLNRIDIQPLFVRYKPSAKNACFRGSTTATTGGSFTSLRDRAIEMWDRCCISLNFLPIIYINNSDYRVLEKSEEKSLIAEYNDPDAIEVFFVEVSDPVGLYGGGKCLSAGTANAQIIAYDTNLPINLYNLAHEIGHAFGLKHPRRLIRNNSTANSLMEPSGFCADNPALMSDENCDNISNPLIYHFFSDSPYVICIRKTNM